MYCSKCGTKLPEGAGFCPKCGQPRANVRANAAAGDGVAPNDSAADAGSDTGERDAVPAQGNGGEKDDGPKGSPDRRRRVALIVLVAVAVVAVVAVAFFAMSNPTGTTASTDTTSQAEQSEDQEPKTVQLGMTIVAPDYDASTDSKIPLRITGTSTSGTAVDQSFYVSQTDDTVEVEEGSYDIEVVASPLMVSGEIYEIPEPVHVEASASQDAGSEQAPEIDFSVKDPADVTQDDIDAAKSAAIDSGYDADKAQEIADQLSEKASMAAFSPVIESYLSKSETGVDKTNGASITLSYAGAFVPVGDKTVLVIGVDPNLSIPDGQFYYEIYAVNDGSAELLATCGTHDDFVVYDNGTFTVTGLLIGGTTRTFGPDESGNLVEMDGAATGSPTTSYTDLTLVPASELAAEVGA